MLDVVDLYKAYEDHFSDLAPKLIWLDSHDICEEDSFFSKVSFAKANAYKVYNSDIFIYCLFSFLNPPNSLMHYLKLPNNRIMLEKFLSNSKAVEKKIAECFDVKVVDNKAINKKVKAKFNHYELTNMPNKHLMILEIIERYKKNKNTDIHQMIKDGLDEESPKKVALYYLLSFFICDEEERKTIKGYIEEANHFMIEKIKYRLNHYCDFAIDILKYANSKRYDLFIDEQLIKLSEYTNQEKENVILAFEQDEKRYLEMIDKLTQRLNQLEKENMELKNSSMKKTSPMNGKKVLVVGDTGRKERYRKIIEQYGGQFEFIDGIFEKEKVVTMVESADLAVLVVPRIKHTVSNVLKINRVPVIFVNSAGIGSFEDVIDGYCAN